MKHFVKIVRESSWRISCFALFVGAFASSGNFIGAEPELAAVPVVYRDGFDSIEESLVRAWTQFLASRELEGRGTGQRGYDLASRYVAAVLQSGGVEPGIDGCSFFQEFDVVSRRAIESAELTVGDVSGNRRELSVLDDVDLRGEAQVDWEAPWLILPESAEIDARVKERVVLIAPSENHQRARLAQLRLAGAQRVVVAVDGRGELLDDYAAAIRASETGRSGASKRDSVIVYLTTEVVDNILKDHTLSVAGLRDPSAGAVPIALDELKIHLRVEVNESRIRTRNVVGLVQGSDPNLRHELVVIGAHLDHLGKQGEEIFVGADDDASGVGSVMAIARAFASNHRKPRRTVVFALFAAEEIGLHGSSYFVDYLAEHEQRSIVALHLDMVGRNEESDDEPASSNTNSMHVVGSKRKSKELDPWLQQVNRFVGLDFEYDEEDSVFKRSDHYNFARCGVPVIFFFAGFHPDYHKVSDTPDKLNFTKIVRVSRLVFALAFEIADRLRTLE